MSTGLHRHLGQGDIHTIAEWVYADDAARLAATGFVAADLYKMAYQISSGTPWLLIGYSPIAWTELAAGSSPQLNRVQVRCVKASAGTLTVGQAVYVASWDQPNDRAQCELARADSPVTMPCVGIINTEATDTTEGSVLILGILHDINTVGLAALSPIYLSHTVAGAIVTTPPPGPYVTQALGQTLRIDATTGHLGVNILSYRAYDYVNTPAPLGTAATGTRNVASPSDHVHAMPKLDDLNAPDDNTDLNATTSAHGLLPKLGGGSTNFLRADGTWNAPPSSPLSDVNPVNVTKSAASAGVASAASRQDHKHDITTAIASAQVPGDSAAEGSATSLARSDHKHSLPAYGTGAATICQGNDSRLSDARTPTAHATTHKSGGSDSVKLDELAAPTDVTTLNATTGAHGLLPKLGGGSTNYLRADGTWATPPGAGGAFGSNFQQGSSDGESSTTGSWTQKLRLTTASLPVGTYRIGWNFEWGKSGLTDFESRVQVNDTTDIMSGFEEAADAGSDQWSPTGGFGYYTGSGVLNIDLDYSAAGADTAKIRRARLEIWRVS